jgi:hypothetical protein
MHLSESEIAELDTLALDMTDSRVALEHTEGLPKLTQDLVDMLGTHLTYIDFEI